VHGIWFQSEKTKDTDTETETTVLSHEANYHSRGYMRNREGLKAEADSSAAPRNDKQKGATE
jgi:hypothetical protein